MGGPGTERATRHKLNRVPHNVGHGDHLLVIGEQQQAGACRCNQRHNQNTTNDTIILPSPTLGYLNYPYWLNGSISNLTLDTINNNHKYPSNNHHQEQIDTGKVDNNDSAKTTMSSPPKHRRGFDPNDTTGGGDYRRYRRVKTRKCFLCIHRDVGRVGDMLMGFNCHHLSTHKKVLSPSFVKHLLYDAQCWIGFNDSIFSSLPIITLCLNKRVKI